MSRIGKRPIKIEEGITVEITSKKVIASCGENNLELAIPEGISIKQVEENLIVDRKDDSKEAKSFHGLAWRLLRNLLTGVKEGFTRELTFTGTGYRVSVAGEEVVMFMGYSHEVHLPIPKSVSVAVKKNSIILTGNDKQILGQFAATLRDVRPPEVYKGKGIKYKEEIIKRKAGKKASS